MNYRPETRARALLGLTTALAARARAPLAYGDVDVDPERARLLRALAAVERIADRLPVAYDRTKALDAFQALAEIGEDDARTECAKVDNSEREAMEMAMAVIRDASPRQGPARPLGMATVLPSPRHKARLHVVPSEDERRIPFARAQGSS